MTQDHLFKNYARADISFETGDGVWLDGSDGRRYLDMGAGIAVSTLGHAHPHLVAALQDAAAKVWHTSNLYRIPEQERLAERLCAATFAERVFFCNSGAEANEAALKTARRYHHANGRPERMGIITMEGAFHGRTLGTLAATGSAKYLEGFGEPLKGFTQVPFGDLDAARAAIGPDTGAIMVEPIQGEGGIRPMERAALAGLRTLADEHGLVLIFDEVQTGLGRLGTLFAYQTAGVTPDILTSAKGLGGGFPIGACLTTEAIAAVMTPGTHGTTFGGNRLAAAAANAVLDVVLAEGFLEEVSRKGSYTKQRLASVVDTNPHVLERVRGEGLMLGVKCKVPVAKVAKASFAEGLVVIPAAEETARFLPPLIATTDELDEAVRRFERAVVAVSAEAGSEERLSA